MLLHAPQPDKKRIMEKIGELSIDPDNQILDIKKLEGNSYFRLRIGPWRVIFDRKDALKIISIEKIKSRGDVYK